MMLDEEMRVEIAKAVRDQVKAELRLREAQMVPKLIEAIEKALMEWAERSTRMPRVLRLSPEVNKLWAGRYGEKGLRSFVFHHGELWIKEDGNLMPYEFALEYSERVRWLKD